MKRKVAKLRLSPNEEARIIREEHERRRKLRIQQVREQQRNIARQIRREVEQRRQRELDQLEEDLRKDWERQQREKLDTLQSLYQESLQLLGQGHRSAKEHEPNLAAIAQREEENHVKAEERYREALKDLKSQKLKDNEQQSRSINARKKALQAEKERSAKVASLPPPLPNPIQSIDSKKSHVVKKSDVSAFAATHYHMPESTVDKEEDTEQPNAHEGAELELRRLQDLEREEKRRREEQLEKARLRGKEALRREHLVQDRDRLLVELEHMQQTDLLRRRQQVSQMPPQIFQPLYKRQETREDFQREIEFAFEDMYTGERRVKGDLVVQLVPEPLPALSTGSQDQELDVTLDEIATQETRNTQHDSDQDAGGPDQETPAQVGPPKPAPRRALKKLLDRIRSQKNQWTDHSSHVPASDSPTTIAHQIPERDTTIDTGSLSSEERDTLPPIELPAPARSPPVGPVLETTEHSTAADTLLPDVLANRIQEFEERRKREQELEREKQQQEVLLQEMEEQKAKLEQMLLEAQQEKEDLKAVVTQGLPINHTELPVHDQEATSVTTSQDTELVPPAGEDEHYRRLREYQQRLVEQNRVHQRSVEVARQRLEEYQRALRIRHNVATTSLLSVPSVLTRPRLHSAQSVHLPAPLQLPTTASVQEYPHTKSQTSVEVPARESDTFASPSQRPTPAVSVSSKLLPDEVESIASSQGNQRPNVTAWLTDNIMERVTEHLKERLRPSSEPLPYKLFPTHYSTGIPLQPTSEPLQAIRPSVPDDATVVPGHPAVMPGTLLRGSLWTGSLNFRESDDMERQRRELQEAQRRMLEQREAMELQERRQEEERQRRELQEVKRRMLGQREQEEERQRRELQEVQIRMLGQREQEEERQRRELQEVQRRVLEQREAMELQERWQEEERQSRELQEVQRRMLGQREQEEERQRLELQEVQRRVLEQREAMELQERWQEEGRQRRELQEVQRRVLEQREAMVLQQRRQEEERQRQEEQRQRQEVEMEQIRRQKETLQALIHTDAQPAPEAASEVLVSENIGQTRLKLLASLLRAIEESNGGTLSHLEDPRKRDDSSPQPPSNSDLISRSKVPAGAAPVSVLPSGLLPPPPPPRAAKPPVTRVRLGIMDVMTEQHELSAIQEVETPADTSQVTGQISARKRTNIPDLPLGPEDSVKVPPHAVDRDLQEDSESSVTSDTSQQTPSWSISGERTAEQSTASGTSSGRSSNVIWRERQLMGAGTSPESSESDLVRRIISPPSSEPGRGADYSGPALTGYRSPTESAHRPPDSDCLSSTTISTGSYVTSDPEQNVNADKSPPLRRVEQGADLLDVSSPCGQSFGVKESSTEGHPRLAADSLFNDSSIQHIIDKYTRELNISLSTAGKTTDSESSYVEETGSSVSQQSLVRVSERRGADERSHQSLPSDTAGAQRSGLEWENTVNPILEHLPGEDTSMGVDQEQDSFRPLIGQLADQSSCLAGDQRVSAMERLVGHPSAHSSMIGQLTTGRPVSTSFDQGGWDSTLSRMIGRLSHHSSSHWLSGGQDFHGGQLMGQMPLEQSTTWLDESRMRPLVGELDESAAQHSGGSDERTHVDLGVSTEASGPSHPVLPPESSSRSVSVPAVNPHLQDQTNMDLGPERTEVFPGSDSFHPLLAEVTHNETADPSMTFHQPEHDGPTSPEGPPASGGSPASTPAEEIEIHTESEPSPEHLRTEDPSSCKADDPALQESYSQLTTSQNQTSESVLIVSPTMMSPEGADADRNAVSERLGNLWPVSDKLWEVGSEKGILEQSQITLVSLTDTTLEDQETAITEDEGTWEDKHQDGASEEGQKGHETEGTESSLSPDETPEDKNQAHPDSGTLLEFQWGPTRDQQEVHHKKRRALLQRSACRVEEIKAKATLAKIQPVSQAPSEAGEQSRSKESQPVPSKERSKTEPQHKTNTKSKGGQAELHQAEKTGFIKQKKPQLLPQVSDFRLKKVDEVKSCTPETRKLEVSEMHQRTQRLYEQLEEVKHQRAIRNRQEACAKNRLKAKEFHRKTLQKLRAKQTQTLL